MLKIATKKQKHVIKYQGAEFTVVPNTKDETQEILKRNTYVHKIKTGPGRKDEYEERTDWTEVHAETMDSQIVDWKGIDGNIECNSENKRALAMCKENDHICQYIQDEISKIGQAAEEQKKKKKAT